MKVPWLATINLSPQCWSFLPFQVLCSWVFLHKKSKFNAPHERRPRHLQPATAPEARGVFPCRTVTQEVSHETLDLYAC